MYRERGKHRSNRSANLYVVRSVHSLMLPSNVNSLKANMAMTGTLQVARVPYDEDDPMYTESVNALDAYAGTYATKGTLKVSSGRVPLCRCMAQLPAHSLQSLDLRCSSPSSRVPSVVRPSGNQAKLIVVMEWFWLGV